MGKWHPLSNLRSYLEHHPPVVIFFLCMLMLSLTFIGVGFYTQTHVVRNPDVTPDWNQFLGSIASLQFCLPLNGSVDGEPASLPREKGNGQPENSVGIVQRSLLVPLAFKGNTAGETPSILSTALLGSQVGFQGAAGKEAFNMSLIFYPPTQATVPKFSLDSSSVAPRTCLQLRAPKSMLPQTPSPPDCPLKLDMGRDHSNIRVFTEQSDSSLFHCLKLDFTPDDSLTAFLSQEDKNLVGLHLLWASATLLAMCGLLCFSASLACCRSRRYHGNDLGLHKEPLLES
ncbi:transmembrane protein 248 isoform X1 [Clupea harengus]|uniref:Transmembrane protein 248 isoform X1 n=1 Tax=Clupea harengus TaxID=7950 RepID=A0A8M1KM11_CLUHA|nr:transmembrane protein 248 isoform X1 [Clupea harengus]